MQRVRMKSVTLMAAGVFLARTVSAQQPSASAPSQSQAGQWTMAAGDYANTRYSTLNQIAKSNVKDLKVAWTFDTGVNKGQEAAPLVVGDTMYVVTPFPNILYA